MGIYVLIPAAGYLLVLGVCLWWSRRSEACEAKSSAAEQEEAENGPH